MSEGVGNQGSPTPEREPEGCAWCGEPSITDVVIVKGRKNKRYQPVCAHHTQLFEQQGQTTRRMEAENVTKREAARAEHMRKTMPWMR